MSAIANLIAAAAQRYGVDPQALTGIGKLESGLNPNAKNPRSSAGGLFQFIDSTAARYGLSNRFDPAAAADAAARLTRDNGTSLSKVLGRAPTGGELYLAHQQGAGGAAKLLANPDAPAASLVGAKAVALNGGQPGMTASQFAGLWDKKFGSAIGQAYSAPPGPAGQAPTPGSALAEALPGASLPVFNVPVSDPAGIAAAYAPLQQAHAEQVRQERELAEKSARRRALLSLAGAYGAQTGAQN